MDRSAVSKNAMIGSDANEGYIMTMVVTLGVLNISDRASAGIYDDIPGRACVDLLKEWLITPFDVA